MGSTGFAIYLAFINKPFEHMPEPAIATWTLQDSAGREPSVRLSIHIVAGVAQSAERLTRKYLPMNAVLRGVIPGCKRAKDP